MNYPLNVTQRANAPDAPQPPDHYKKTIHVNYNGVLSGTEAWVENEIDQGFKQSTRLMLVLDGHSDDLDLRLLKSWATICEGVWYLHDTPKVRELCLKLDQSNRWKIEQELAATIKKYMDDGYELRTCVLNQAGDAEYRTMFGPRFFVKKVA